MAYTLLESLPGCYESYLYQFRLNLAVTARFRNTEHGLSQMFNVLYSRTGAEKSRMSCSMK